MQPPTFTPRGRFLVNAITAAFVLRFLRLNDVSLWTDEGATWANATHGTWTDSVTSEANHPPVWWLVTRLWVSLAGDGEMALRAPAAILSALSVWLAYLLARRLLDPARVPCRGGFTGFDDGAPLWVAGLAAASAFGIEYGQEARMYAALLACSLGLSLLYLRWLDTGRRGPLVGYAALGALSLYTHYFAVWPMLAHGVHALWTLRRRDGSTPSLSPKPLVLSQIAAAVVFLPWFAHLLSSSPRVDSGDPYEPFSRLANALWRMGTGPAIAALDRPRVDAGGAAVFAEAWPVILGTALLWAVPIGFGVRALWRDRGARGYVAVSVLLPIVFLLALHPWFPLLHEKYLIFVWPFLLILAVLGARAARGFLRPLLLGGLVVLHAAGLVAYHGVDAKPVVDALSQGHAYGKEEWFQARAWIDRRAADGDVVLLHAPITKAAWDYYDRGRTPTVVLEGPPMSRESLGRAYPFLPELKHVFLVLSHEETNPKDAWAKALHEYYFAEWGTFQTEREDFPASWGIRVWRFSRSP